MCKLCSTPRRRHGRRSMSGRVRCVLCGRSSSRSRKRTRRLAKTSTRAGERRRLSEPCLLLNRTRWRERLRRGRRSHFSTRLSSDKCGSKPFPQQRDLCPLLSGRRVYSRQAREMDGGGLGDQPGGRGGAAASSGLDYHHLGHEAITICSGEEAAWLRDEEGCDVKGMVFPAAPTVSGRIAQVGVTKRATLDPGWSAVCWRRRLELLDHRADQTFWNVAQDDRSATSEISQWSAWPWFASQIWWSSRMAQPTWRRRSRNGLRVLDGKVSSSSNGMTGARELLGGHACVLKQVVSLSLMLPQHLLQNSKPR